MKKTKKQNRWLALALCLCLLASVFPLSGMTYAAGTGCNHVHDDACGYVEAVEGQPCTFAHEHDDACGYAEATEASPCSVEAAHTVHDETCGGDPDTGEGCTFTHEHDDACGWAEAKEAAPCSVEAAHTVHDAAVCGFVEAVQGALCGHVHDESCGGLQAEPTACTLTEDCKLPDGHEGACELPTMLGAPPNNTTAVDSGNCGWNGADNMQWSLGTDGVLTISGSGNMGNYYYMGDNQPPWYDYRGQITSVIIEAGVANIGYYAFYKCTSLTSVTFPDSLQSIELSAFGDCTGLTGVTFPEGLQNIWDNAFYNCTNLKALTFLGNAPPTIRPNAFYGVSASGDIHYPAGAGASYTDEWKNDTAKLSGWTLTEQSGPAANEYHSGDVAVINGIIDNNGLTWTKDNPASWNTTVDGSPYLKWDDSTPKRIKELYIPDIDLSGELNVTGLTSLQELYCSRNSLTGLNVTGLTSLQTLYCQNNSLTGTLDVSGLTSLQELYCQNNSLTGLNVSGLTSLQELYCQNNSLTGLNVTGLTSLRNLYCYSSSLTGLDLTGLTSLRYLSCYSNPLQSLKLPGGETLTVNIAPANSGTVMFSHRIDLLNNKSITLTATAGYGYTFDGWTGDASGSDNPYSFTLGGNKSITANFAVDPATTLTVEFNDNKSGGNSLDENEMKTAVETALSSGDKTKITAIRLTGRAAEITGYNWKYLLNLYRSGGDWTNLTVMDLSGMGNLGKIKNEINSYNEIHQLTAVRFPDSLQTIGDYAFYRCISLADVPFPNGLQTIGNRAFNSCGRLQSVSFPAGLQTIGVAAFSRCGLQSVSFPKGLQTIGNEAFSYCTGLTAFAVSPDNQQFASEDGVLYDKGIETLLQYPMAKSGTSFAIPDTVKTIGDGAFSGCDALQSVSFPKGLQTIGDGAFSFCVGLTSMTFLGQTPPSLDGNAFGVWIDGGNVSTSGTLYHPARAAAAYASGAFGSPALNGWTRKALYALTVNGGSDETGQTLYPEGAQVQIKANAAPAGKTFEKWTGGSDSIFASGSRTAASTTITMPASDVTVTANFTRNSTPPTTYSLTVQAGQGGSVSGTPSGDYAAGADISVTATADPGYTFTGWTANGITLGSATANPASFQMPAGTVTLTATFTKNGGGSGGGDHDHSYGGWKHDDTYHWHECSCGDIADKVVHDFGSWITDKKPTETSSGSRHRDCKVCNYRQTESLDPTGPDYEYRTLTDEASGVKVSGYFTGDAALEVKEMLLHLQGDCDVCDDIRQRQKNGELIVLFDISLKSGKYKGELDVEIPVGEQYNGQTAIMLHCKDKVLESRTVTVSGGVARGTFSSLSPYAVAKVTGSTAITGLPESYTLLVGQTVSWTPAPAGGAWSYDKDLLSMTKDGDTYTFKALKEGKATATYTVDGVPHTITITVNSSTIPQTGDMSSPWPWTLLMLAALLGCAALVLGRKGGYQKRHE